MAENMMSFLFYLALKNMPKKYYLFYQNVLQRFIGLSIDENHRANLSS